MDILGHFPKAVSLVPLHVHQTLILLCDYTFSLISCTGEPKPQTLVKPL